MARWAARPLNRHQGAWRNVAIGVALLWALGVALDVLPDQGGGSGDGGRDGVLRGSGSANEAAGTAGPPGGGGAPDAPRAASVDETPVLRAPTAAGASRRAASTSRPAPGSGGNLGAPVSDLAPPPPLVEEDGSTAVRGAPGVAPTTVASRAPAPVAVTTPVPEEASVEPAPPVDVPDDGDGDDNGAEEDDADDDDGPGHGRGRGRGGDDRGPNGPKDEDE